MPYCSTTSFSYTLFSGKIKDKNIQRITHWERLKQQWRNSSAHFAANRLPMLPSVSYHIVKKTNMSNLKILSQILRCVVPRYYLYFVVQVQSTLCHPRSPKDGSTIRSKSWDVRIHHTCHVQEPYASLLARFIHGLHIGRKASTVNKNRWNEWDETQDCRHANTLTRNFDNLHIHSPGLYRIQWDKEYWKNV